MGPSGSPVWHALLDAAEDLLRSQGYASLNARRVAMHAGVTRQLFYYYFCDNDDLYVQLFGRLAEREIARLDEALISGAPLRSTWDAGILTRDAALLAEFLALANRSEPVRQAVFDYVAVSRKIQIAVIREAFAREGLPELDMPFSALAVLATGVATVIQGEAALGFSEGHREILEVIGKFLSAVGTPEAP